jgi:hypothetical protein
MEQIKIKTGIWLWMLIIVLSGIVAIPKTAFTRDDDDRRIERRERWRDNRREARELQGRWYMDGDRNRPADINGDQARNERGETSRLEVDRDGNVHASDWQGVRGHVRGNRIEWDNGTTWTRRPGR